MYFEHMKPPIMSDGDDDKYVLISLLELIKVSR